MKRINPISTGNNPFSIPGCHTTEVCSGQSCGYLDVTYHFWVFQRKYSGYVSLFFIRIKKGEGQEKEKCHAKSMMSKEANEMLKRDTQHVPLRLWSLFICNWIKKGESRG